MKKIAFKCLSLFLCPLLFFTCRAAGSEDRPARLSPITCFVAGHDTAAGNTDVMAVVSYDPAALTLTVLQIPRDTYFGADTYQNKLNQYYPACLSRGLDRPAAMRDLTDALSVSLGVPMDGYVSVTYDDVALAVDAVGGVTLTVPKGFSFTAPDGTSHVVGEGRQTLDGQSAVAFLRYRSGYEKGDLDRLDAQKAFACAFLSRVRSLSLKDALTLLRVMHGRAVTDLPLTGLLLRAPRFLSSFPSLRLSTLAGTAVRKTGDSGLWYYVPSFTETSSQVAELLPTNGGFDPDKRFYDANNPYLSAAYDSDNCQWTLYSPADFPR